ncbi:hypothetical protein ACFLWM_02625, partial [Chloroflexota bacterium]
VLSHQKTQDEGKMTFKVSNHMREIISASADADLPKKVLNGIVKYRKERGYGESTLEIKRPSAVRSRPAGTVKRRTANLRQAKTRKRLPVHSTKR